VEIKLEDQISKNAPDMFHLVIPSETIKQTLCCKIPYGVAKNSIKYIKIANISDQDITIKKNALVAHLVATNPNANVHFIEKDSIDNDKEEIEDDIIGDNIYIPNQIDDKIITDREIRDHITPSVPHLENSQKEQLEQLIIGHKKIFAFNPNSPGVQTKTRMHIELKENTTPIKLPPYRTSPVIAKEMNEIISKLLEDGLIEKSKSPWSFPVVMVKKPDGSKRFCVDYSKLSERTIKDAYPLPRIDDTLDHLFGAKFFTVCDASSGFWQVPIAEKDKEKLAFTTTFGTYQWHV
ncbi:MAG TPA: reverse transcriptase family protein, partial [Candidatus Dojkabacteria bacterium]|nr:reverse transcriptase family protein [Candidatus Dojkabacteria bacterium]